MKIQKRIKTHFQRNFVFLIIFLCIIFVALVVGYKLFFVPPVYVYTKVKVGQGTWWATTQKPSLWFVKAIKQAKEQKDLTGKPVAEVINVSYYPYYATGQYDVYVTVKLKVSQIGNKGTYNFNREVIGISSPINLEFPNVQFAGTIIALSEKPFKETYENKTVYLYKKNVNPWEYDQIYIGDTLAMGEDAVFKIVDKERGETNDVLLSDLGRQINWDIESYRYVRIKARIRVKKVDGQYIFGEEYVISPGRAVPISLSNLVLNDYMITKIDAQ